ncbi:MAG: sensor histidine kinase [bacterium]
MNLVRSEVIRSHTNLLSLHLGKLEDELDSISLFLYTMESQDPDVISFSTLYPEGLDYVLLTRNIIEKFHSQLANHYNLLDSLIIYSQERDELFLAHNHKKDYFQRHDYLKENINQIIEKRYSHSFEWQTIKIANSNHLLKNINSPLDISLVALINVENLLEPLRDINLNRNSNMVIISNEDEILLNKGIEQGLTDDIVIANRESHHKKYFNLKADNGVKYLLIKEDLKQAGLTFVFLIPEKDILRNLPVYRKMIYIILLLGILVLLLIIVFMRKFLFKPLNQIIQGMKKISVGDFDARLDENRVQELNAVTHSFNEMASQIHDLKIDIYEEKIRSKKAELKHLQAQINPHFYLNSLNIVYNLAAYGDFKLIQKMVFSLSKYFRYTIKTNKELVPLLDEIKHVENYLEIQKIRFDDLFVYEINILERYKQYHIPPLTIQPFVENSVLHGFNKEGKKFYIKIDISKIFAADKQYLKIMISDNGVGFPEEVLARLRSIEHKEKADAHIGIWNVYRRLKLYFGDDSKILFDNIDNTGAKVDILIPLQTLKKETGEQGDK